MRYGRHRSGRVRQGKVWILNKFRIVVRCSVVGSGNVRLGKVT